MQVLEAPGDTRAAEQLRESRRAIEAIEPQAPADAPPRKLVFAWTKPDGQPIAKEYTQGPLGHFPVQEFTTRIGEVIDGFTKGEYGDLIGDLFRGEVEMPVKLEADEVNDFITENVAMIQMVVKLFNILPDLQLDIMCMSLGIPRLERPWAKEQLQEPPHRGGLTVEDGFDLLIYFVKQNAPLVREVVLGKARELADVFRLYVLGEDKTETPTSSSSTDSETIPATPTDEGFSLGGTPTTTSSPDTPEND